MNKVLQRTVLMSFVLASAFAGAAVYKLDGAHSDVSFKVKHLMLTNVKGRFDKVEGGFDYDAKAKTLSKVDISIDVASVDTNEKKRDEHLTSPDFFNAKAKGMGTITFKADKVTGVEAGKSVKVPGTLMMHGVSKPVTLDVDFRGVTTDPMGNDKVVFGATTKISRADFGMTWNKNLDKGGVVVGDEITVEIEAEANKTK